MVDFYHVLTLKCPICRTVQKKPLAISPDRSKTSTAWHGCNFQQQNRDSTSKKCDFIPPSVRVLGTRWGGTKFDPKSAPFVYFQPRGSSFWQPKMDGLKHKKWLDHLSYPIGLTYMFFEKNKQTIFDDIPKFGPTHLGVSPTWNSDYHVRFFWGPSMFGETQLGL